MLTDDVGLSFLQKLDCVVNEYIAIEKPEDILQPDTLTTVLQEVVPEVVQVDSSTVESILRSVDDCMEILENSESSRLTSELFKQPASPSLVVEFMLVASTVFGTDPESQEHVVSKILELPRAQQELIQSTLKSYTVETESEEETESALPRVPQTERSPDGIPSYRQLSARRDIQAMASQLDDMREMERILKEELARKNEEVHRLKNNDQETLRLSATRGADEIESLEAEIRALKSVVDKQKGEIKDMLAQKEEQEKFAKGAMEEVAVWQKEAVGLGLQLDRLKAKNTDMSTLEDQLQSAQKQADEYLTLLLQAQEQLGKSESTEKDIDIKNRTIHELEQNLEVLHASHEKLTTQHKHLKEALDMAETRLQGQQAVPNDPYHGHDDSKVTITMREKEELFRLRKAARDTSETALSSELQEARAAKERLQKLVDVQRTQLETYSDTQPVTQGSTEQLERENRILVETRSLESNERRREQRTMASVIHELAFRLHTLQMERSRLLETHLVDVETLKSAILEQKHLDGSRS